MLKCVPPTVFFGTRTTRGQTKSENERAIASKNTSTTKVHKLQDVALQKSSRNERQLRSVLKKSPLNANEPATTALTPPASNIQRNLRACKNARRGSPQQSSSKATTKTQRAQAPSNKKPFSNNAKPPQEKNPVYKQALVESTFVNTPVLDEYEFQVETPEGTSKKPKRRQQRQKNKIQTLWGLTVRPETKKKLKPSKKVVIHEPENVKSVDKVVQANVVLKDAQPGTKKTPPLQERTANTLGNNVASGVGGGIFEKFKGSNVVTFSDRKKNTDKSTTEGITKCVKIRNKQSEEFKENNPRVKKKTVDESGAKVFQIPLKQSVLSVHSNCTLPQTRPPQCAMNNSPVKSTGLYPPTINNMSVFLSPIRGSEDSAIQCINESPNERSIHASTPLQSNGHRSDWEPKDADISSDREVSSSSSHTMPPLTSSLSVRRSAQSTSLENDFSHEQSQDFDDQHSSNTAPDPDNSDGLYDPGILEDFHIDGKPSIPARLLEGRKPTIFTGSKSPQVDRFSQWRQGANHLAPVGSTDGPWRIFPGAKYIYPYEPTLDNCFGFDNGPEAYAIEIYNPKQHVIQKSCPLRRESPSPQSKKIPGSHPEESPPPQPVERPFIQPEKHWLRSQIKPSESPSENTSSLCDAKIDEMFSLSLSRLRKRKYADSIVYDSTTSNENLNPNSASQLTDVTEDNNTRCNQQVSFLDDMEKGIFDSPFTERPRRSYSHLRRLKRVIEEEDGDEEVDGDEEEKERRGKPSKQKKTGHKRRKVVQTTLLNQWAKDLSSHFAEVDDVELITE